MSMGDEFKGLPIEDLIGAPLIAAANAQGKLAAVTAEFIKTDLISGRDTGVGVCAG